MAPMAGKDEIRYENPPSWIPSLRANPPGSFEPRRSDSSQVDRNST